MADEPQLIRHAILRSFHPDIQKILHEEQNNSTEEGWSFVKRTEQCEIWRKNERDKPVHLIKVRE